MNTSPDYDVVVVGGGHAGAEAALAAARMGVKTLMITSCRDAIARMPCNPSIGGLAKSHLVRELDALGGEMGRNADATALQAKTLNLSRGPAVWATRAQCAKREYTERMQAVVASQPNLTVLEASVTSFTPGTPITVFYEGKVVVDSCRKDGDNSALQLQLKPTPPLTAAPLQSNPLCGGRVGFPPDAEGRGESRESFFGPTLAKPACWRERPERPMSVGPKKDLRASCPLPAASSPLPTTIYHLPTLSPTN